MTKRIDSWGVARVVRLEEAVKHDPSLKITLVRGVLTLTRKTKWDRIADRIADRIKAFWGTKL